MASGLLFLLLLGIGGNIYCEAKPQSEAIAQHVAAAQSEAAAQSKAAAESEAAAESVAAAESEAAAESKAAAESEAAAESKAAAESEATARHTSVCLPFFCRRCPRGWTKYGGRCYQFQDQELAWADAEMFCNRYDGHLTSIQGPDQYKFIRDLIFRGAGYNKQSWVGGTNAVREDLWMWTDGTQFTFDFWGPGEPNNQGGDEHCMDINLGGRDYVNDEVCTQQNSFVCIKDL